MNQLEVPIVAEGHSGLDWGLALARHEGWLRTVILARTGERAAVDEVWQEVALAAIAQRAPLHDPVSLPAWLHRLAIVRSIRYRRDRARQRKLLASYQTQAVERLSPDSADGLSWLLRKERQQLVAMALCRLRGRDREILLLKHVQRWSYRRLAEIFKTTESAIDARLFRARQKLRKELEGI